MKNISQISGDMYKAVAAKMKKDISNDIKRKFPEILLYSVDVHNKTLKIKIEGLTEDQIVQLDHVRKL